MKHFIILLSNVLILLTCNQQAKDESIDNKSLTTEKIDTAVTITDTPDEIYLCRDSVWMDSDTNFFVKECYWNGSRLARNHIAYSCIIDTFDAIIDNDPIKVTIYKIETGNPIENEAFQYTFYQVTSAGITLQPQHQGFSKGEKYAESSGDSLIMYSFVRIIEGNQKKEFTMVPVLVTTKNGPGKIYEDDPHFEPELKKYKEKLNRLLRASRILEVKKHVDPPWRI